MRTCEVVDSGVTCGRKAVGHGYCNKHYQRYMKHGDASIVYKRGPKPSERWCKIEGCGEPHNARGMCFNHYQTLRKYDLTPHAYNKMMLSQGHACAICHTSEPTGHGWHIDHDHDTGQVRGLLCFMCNTGLGQFNDSPDTLMAAVTYLLQFSDILNTQPVTQEVTQ